MKNLSNQLKMRSNIGITTKSLFASMLILFISTGVIAQTSKVYIKLTDQAGTQIKGECVAKGFERWIEALTINSSGKNNTELSFTMNIAGSSAAFKKALGNNEVLLNGLVTVQTVNSATAMPTTAYTITMERISVVACTESMGCNNVMTTSVMLRSVRIGWTYYQASRSGGMSTVSNKYGWDAEANAAWSAF
jgi:type VI protein secretion system component Hcp